MVAKAELVATLFSVAEVGLAAVKALRLRPEGLCEAHVLLVRLALLLHDDLVVLLGVEPPGTVHHGHSVIPPLLQLQFLLWQLIRQFAGHLLEYSAIVATNYGGHVGHDAMGELHSVVMERYRRL